MEASLSLRRLLPASWRPGGARLTDRIVAVGLLAWAAPDIPWWWRPPGHGAATPVVLGYLTLTLAQSVPFVWWRRVPLLAAGLAATVLAIRTGLGQNPYSAAAATAAGAFGLGAWGHRRTRLIARILTAAAVTAAALVLLTSDGFRAQALPLALLATALGLGEVTAAYRVVQESLTNALRYARSAPASVALSYHDDGLDLTVENDAPVAMAAGRRAAAAPGGEAGERSVRGGARGLQGLAERAQLLGGSLQAGPRPGGGFSVHAWLPAR